MSASELLRLDARALPVEAIEERFRETACHVYLGDVPGWTATAAGQVDVEAPTVAGTHDLLVRLFSGDGLVAENRYPIHVVVDNLAGVPVRVVGDGPTAAALAAVGATVGDEGTTVVAEDALDDGAGRLLGERLAAGEVVVVLAQRPAGAPFYPVDVRLEALTSVWGSTVFRFTTDHGAIPTLPRRAVLVAEDATVQATDVVASIGGVAFPDTPVVLAYKPVPGAMTGTVVGAHEVGPGRLVFCQYRLAAGAAAGDPAARALLGDVLRWASVPRPVLAKRHLVKDDGRALVDYSWEPMVAR